MKILTISLNAWNDTKATGNTFSNFFANKEEDTIFSNIYCRKEPYQNTICEKYYRVTESDIIKSLLKGTPCGNEVKCDKISEGHKDGKRISKTNVKDWLMHKFRPSVMLFFREFVWLTDRWKSLSLDKFLDEVSPDIIYMHGHNNRYMHDLLWYCQKKTNAKVVVFFGDDMYGLKSYRPGQLLYHQWLRKKLVYTIEHTDMLLGGSQKLCLEYGERFSRVFYPQYKTCTNIVFPNVIGPKSHFSLVYAGNLLYGRKEMLIQLVKVLKKVNQLHESKIQLFIYSANPLSLKELSILNDCSNSFFMGGKPYKEICEILNKCDVSLFLESFEKHNIRQTRLSFSTKIIDYMQSSSSLLVYGPKEIASVQYLADSCAALVANNEAEMESILDTILNDPTILNEYAALKHKFALENHVSSILLDNFQKLVKQ